MADPIVVILSLLGAFSLLGVGVATRKAFMLDGKMSANRRTLKCLKETEYLDVQ